MPTPFCRRSKSRQTGDHDHQCASRFTVAETGAVELAPYFERLISSHDYGYPKENPQFWDALQADIDFDPARSLFIDDTLPILRSAGNLV
jgi:HAD superfamily hydrolase (TIGR01509 family)